MKPKTYLVFSGIIIAGVGLLYGLVPEDILLALFNLEMGIVENSSIHMFRALAGLYLAMASLFVLGGLKVRFRSSALTALIVFMFGVAVGRIVSIIIDEPVHWLFYFFLLSELAMGSLGILYYRKENT